MADLRYYDIIDKPVITEKSMAGMEYKRYTFYVHTEATKSQIKEAVEKMFPGTKVAKVNTMNLDGKTQTWYGSWQDSKEEKSDCSIDRGQC